MASVGAKRSRAIWIPKLDCAVPTCAQNKIVASYAYPVDAVNFLAVLFVDHLRQVRERRIVAYGLQIPQLQRTVAGHRNYYVWIFLRANNIEQPVTPMERLKRNS